MKLKSQMTTYVYDLGYLDEELVQDLSYQQRKVEISFINGKFCQAKFYFTAPYTEGQWEILSIINEEIKTLKERYETKVHGE